MKQTGDEQGYTMLEAIMYVSLLIVLGAALAHNLSSVLRRYRTGRTAQQVIDLKKAILYYTAANNDYTDLDRDEMVESNAMPMDMVSGYHALNGEILLGCVADEMSDPTPNDKYMFYITFRNLYQAGCIEVLTQGQFYGDGSEMDTLIVNDNYGWRYQYSLYNYEGKVPNMTTLVPEAGKTTGIYINFTDALAACSDKNNNQITWIFS